MGSQRRWALASRERGLPTARAFRWLAGAIRSRRRELVSGPASHWEKGCRPAYHRTQSAPGHNPPEKPAMKRALKLGAMKLVALKLVALKLGALLHLIPPQRECPARYV